MAADEKSPVLLVIQGELAENGAAIYQRYLEGTRPIMQDYRVRIAGVGGGLASEHTTDVWPVNAVLEFPDREAAEAFFADARYEAIRPLRDEAYARLHLSFIQTRPPAGASPRDVAEDGFARFQRGLAHGEWSGFLELLTDDFTFWFPKGRYRGEHHGKAKAEEFFRFVSETFPGGLQVDEVLRRTSSGDTFVFELRDSGTYQDKPYRNRAAISLDVRDDKICAYREYFGSDGTAN